MSNEKQNPLWYLFAKNWQYSQGYHKKIVSYWVLFIIAQCINLFMNPLVCAKIVQVISTEGINSTSIKTLVLLSGLLVLRSILFWVLHMPARILELMNAFRVRTNYRKFLLKGVMTMPLKWHAGHHSGDTIDRIEKGATALYAFSEDSFNNIHCFVQIIGSYIMLMYFSWIAACIALPMFVLSIWITMRFDRILIPQYKKLNRSENLISESVFDAISNISTVIILRVEKFVFNSIAHKLETPFELFTENVKRNEAKWFLTSVCCNIMIALALCVYFFQHLGAGPGALSGSVYLLMRYLDEIGELFFKFAGSYSNIIKRRTRVGNAEELSADFIPGSFVNHVLPKDWKKLDIRNLTFSYFGLEEEGTHLNNVSFFAHHGERIALVGETGSGKSTFLKVMGNFYGPRSLGLSVDGQEIPNGFEGISRAITLIQQSPEIFSKTIWENITMGAEYGLDFVLKFTHMACFTDVVMGLPKKFDSSIREKGVNLSGGQQQRLALSRGLLACHDKDIVLLDEPTSSLDTITEITVYQNIFREFKGKTIVSTIHQLHLLPLFDRVCVFDRGEIIATGTLAELLSSCHKFVSLWEAMQKASVGDSVAVGM